MSVRKGKFASVRFWCAVVGAWSACFATGSGAQELARDFPHKPVRLVVPYAPGGNSDFIARELGRRLTQTWNVPVVVDNRPGAGSLLGLATVAGANPDGYTLVLATSAGLAIAPALGISMRYDPLKSFAPIGLAVYAPFALAVGISLPVNTISELISLAKAKPGHINFASPGTGTPNHLGGEMLKSMTGINIVHVPYKGSGPALTDLLAGQVQMMFAGVPQVLPQMKSGKLRVVAVGHPKRIRALPDVPAVAETVPDFDNSSWFGLLAPAGTPRQIVAKINAAMNAVFGSPEVVTRLMAVGVEAATTTPEEFQQMIRSEHARWQKVISETGVKVKEKD